MQISIPRGFKIGHYNDDFTGVTVILSPKGAVGGCDCRGGAPGTRETDLLKSEKMMQKINAVVLSGGSAYGLAACDGVMRYLKDNGIGYRTAGKLVPIVCGAVIFDLNQKEYHLPTPQYGVYACENADKPLVFGNVGVGKGATVGKLRGLGHACKSGVGAATVRTFGYNVTAVIAVNAMGDVVDSNGNIIAGAKGKNGFINTEKTIVNGELGKMLLGANTTIGCVLTDAKLTKVQANRLATAAHNGLARSIRPVHTDFDGDTIFCLASGKKALVAPDMLMVALQSAAVLACEQAIRNAVSSVTDDIIYDPDEESDEGTESDQCENDDAFARDNSCFEDGGPASEE